MASNKLYSKKYDAITSETTGLSGSFYRGLRVASVVSLAAGVAAGTLALQEARRHDKIPVEIAGVAVACVAMAAAFEAGARSRERSVIGVLSESVHKETDDLILQDRGLILPLRKEHLKYLEREARRKPVEPAISDLEMENNRSIYHARERLELIDLIRLGPGKEITEPYTPSKWKS